MSKPLLRVFEHSKSYFEAPLDIKEAVELNLRCESLSKYSKREVLVPILNSSNQTIGVQARNFVGIVELSKRTIQILPKMSSLSQEELANEQSINNLLFMLSYTGKFQIPHLDRISLKTFKGDFFEILIYMYANSLIEQLRNSLHQEYISKEDNLTHLRGKLIFNRHMNINAFQKSRFYVRSDEFSSNNKLNQIFKYVSFLLLRSTKNVINKHLLTEICQMLQDVPSSKIITYQDAKAVNFTRLNGRFEPSLEFAKLFLDKRSLAFRQGEFNSMTFLIDMNALFENFITTLLKKNISPTYKIQAQGPIRHLIKDVEPKGIATTPLFRMKPDIAIFESFSNNLISIVDTKYKLLDETENKWGVAQSDLYQMYAYAKIYDIKRIVLLYPSRANKDFDDITLFSQDGISIFITTINLGCDLKKHLGKISNELLHKLGVYVSRV